LIARYKSAELAIIGTTFFTEGGDWRSIYLYARRAESEGKSIVFVNPSDKRGLRQALAVWAFAPRVIVNGLNSFDSWCVLAMCMLRPDVRIYLHETEVALDSYREAHPVRYALLRHILGRNPLLCVSQKAETLYRQRFGTSTTHVVYECPGDDDAWEFEPGCVHILNVGSLNERKGVELFSKVADLARERHPDWRFHWIGGVATMNNLYRSPAVKWYGFTWHPTEALKKCQLFFLSSVDDPCPLSLLEALQQGMPCVAYDRTGSAEIIGGLPGCAVYSAYEPAAAMAAIEKALAEEDGDRAARARAASEISGARAFARRIERAFE